MTSNFEWKTMTEQEFTDKYKPRPNLKESADGSYFNFEHSDTCRMVNGEWEIRPELGITDKQVWTIIDCEDDGEVVSAGFHIVNKVAYIITEVPWETGGEEAIWYDGRWQYAETIEDQEDHASFCDSGYWVEEGKEPHPCTCGFDEYQASQGDKT